MTPEDSSTPDATTTRSPKRTKRRGHRWTLAAAGLCCVVGIGVCFAVASHQQAVTAERVETQHQGELEAAVQSARASASAAIEAATDVGYRQGHRAGQSIAAVGAYDEGREDGYAAGLAAGADAASSSGYTEGYLDGAQVGYESGYADGYSDAHVTTPTMSEAERVAEYNRVLECMVGARDWGCG